MLNKIMMIAPMGLLLIAGIIYLMLILRRKKKYTKYLNMAGYLTGKDAAYLMMKRAGYDSKFVIAPPSKSLDPFSDNVYFPDKNVFMMRREIMDGRSLLSLCIGCQLAASAINYNDGKINLPGSGIYLGEYGIRYIFNEKEIGNVIPEEVRSI